MNERKMPYSKLYDEIINPTICNQFHGLCEKLNTKGDESSCKNLNYKNCKFYQKVNQISNNVKIQQQVRKYNNLINQTIKKIIKYIPNIK